MHSCWYALFEIGRGSGIAGALLVIIDCRLSPPTLLWRRPEFIADDTLRFVFFAVDAGVAGRTFSRPTRGIMEALPRGGRVLAVLWPWLLGSTDCLRFLFMFPLLWGPFLP